MTSRTAAWLGCSMCLVGAAAFARVALLLGVIPVALAAWPIRGPILTPIGDSPPARMTVSGRLPSTALEPAG
jgi:hypothetical protein